MSLYDKMILDKRLTRARFQAFFEALTKDPELQGLFIKDPAGVLKKMNVIWGNFNVSNANRLLFALLSNRELVSWAREYQSQLEEEHGGAIDPLKLDRRRIYQDFIQAMSRSMDPAILTSLIQLSNFNAIEANIALAPLATAIADVTADIGPNANARMAVLLCADIGAEGADGGGGAQVLCSGPVADTVLVSETAVAVVVVAVFVFALTMIDITPKPQRDFQDVLDRTKLATLLDTLSVGLRQTGQQYRSDNSLCDPKSFIA